MRRPIEIFCVQSGIFQLTETFYTGTARGARDKYEFIEICSRFSLVKWTNTFLEISQTTLNICHLTFFKGLVQSDRFYGLSICPICWVFPWANIIFLFWLCCDLLLFWRFITEMKTLWSWTIVSKIGSTSKTFPKSLFPKHHNSRATLITVFSARFQLEHHLVLKRVKN